MPAENLLGERGRGFAQFLPHPRRGPDRDRRAGHRPRAGLRRRVGALRQGAARVRPADRRLPGHPVHDRRHGDARPPRPPGLPRRRRRDARRRATSSARRRSPSCYASESAVDNARDATQIHGGYGFMNEFPVARFWRDAQDPGDRRGHLGDPAHGHRPRPGHRLARVYPTLRPSERPVASADSRCLHSPVLTWGGATHVRCARSGDGAVAVARCWPGGSCSSLPAPPSGGRSSIGWWPPTTCGLIRRRSRPSGGCRSSSRRAKRSSR